jgi:hypothetical protein
MPQLSYARMILEQMEIPFEDIPTSDGKMKKEADFLASFGDSKVLIEEKLKEDDLSYLSMRGHELEAGGIHEHSLSLTRDETISGIIRHAAKQIKSSSDKPHDFRLLWFTATGVAAEAKSEQFMATLYGRTNIIERGANDYKRCYYFRYSDFYRRSAIIDGAAAAFVKDASITLKLCLNSLSPRYLDLKHSSVVKPFRTAVEDPLELEARGGAFILDSDIDRKDEQKLLDYLKNKYKTEPLMTTPCVRIDMALRQIPMTMQDWEKRLNRFIEATDREILQDAGRVTAEIAKAHAESEFEKYCIIQDRLFESDFDRMIKQLEQKNEDDK